MRLTLCEAPARETKYKAYPFNLENDEKTGIFCMVAKFQSDFWKLKLASKNPRAGNGRWIFPETESVLILKIGEG